MAFTLNNLPFAPNVLEPHISAHTLEFHHGKHHQTYVDNLNKLIVGTEWENKSLAEIILGTSGKPESVGIFNNAAQVYNHDFFWQSLLPNTKPSAEVSEMITKDFGSLDNFKAELKTLGLGQFGSGWIWLVLKDGNLSLMKTGNAENPLTSGFKPLLTIDVWEHSYYLDYQNRRADYLEAVINNLLNWDFVKNNLAV